MSKTIIKVENLSKRYRIGLKEEKAQTFAEQIVRTLKYPIQNFKQIRNLGKFGHPSLSGSREEGVHWALKDVSFEVKEGEVLGIIGKNGAGKSTLLKILSRITEPTSGKITVHGRIAALLEVGTGFHPELTGRENIYMNGTILGMTRKEIDRKIDEIIDFSGIEKYVDTPVKFYSSGMRVRLGFSVAAHLDPEILVIDEVLAVGDYEFQQKCLGKMEDVSKNEGRTVLFVSHNMGAIQNLCTTTIVLNSGKTGNVLSVEDGIKEYMDLGLIPKKNLSSILIERVLLLDHNFKESNIVKVGEVARVQIFYKSDFSLDEFDIGFFIKDKYGDKVASVSTSFKKPNPNSTTQSNSILFSINDLKLVDDNYSLDLSIVKKGGRRIEYLEDVLRFQISSSDFYKTGTILNNYFGKLYLDFDYCV